MATEKNNTKKNKCIQCEFYLKLRKNLMIRPTFGFKLKVFNKHPPGFHPE